MKPPFARNQVKKRKKSRSVTREGLRRMPGRLVGARAWIWPLAGCLMLSLCQQMVQCTPATLVTKQLSAVFITSIYVNIYPSGSQCTAVSLDLVTADQ